MKACCAEGVARLDEPRRRGCGRRTWSSTSDETLGGRDSKDESPSIRNRGCPHVLGRYTTMLLRAGVNVHENQTYFGHRSLETTARYLALLKVDTLCDERQSAGCWEANATVCPSTMAPGRVVRRGRRGRKARADIRTTDGLLDRDGLVRLRRSRKW